MKFFINHIIYIFSRGLKFYGKTIDEAIQFPGEIVYAPNNLPHAVYNLDETVAVGENPYFSSALEESAYQLYYENIIYFAHVNGTEVVIHPGQ